MTHQIIKLLVDNGGATGVVHASNPRWVAYETARVAMTAAVCAPNMAQNAVYLAIESALDTVDWGAVVAACKVVAR